MSQGNTTIVVRARSTRESLDLAFPFMFQLGGARYVALASVVQLVLFGAAMVAFRAANLRWPGVWIFALPFAIALQGVFTVAAGELMFAGELRVAVVLRKFLGRFFPYAVALLLSRLAVLLTITVPIVPPFVWSRWLFIPEVVLLEGASVIESMRRSSRLAKGSASAVVELMFWIFAVLAFGMVAAEAIGRALFEYTLQISLESGSLFGDGGSYFSAFGLFAALPVAATLRFLAYIDARARRDAWEVQIRMQRIAQLATRTT